MHILYPLKPRGHTSRAVGWSQGMISGSGAGTPNLYLCRDPVIQKENFATGLITVQILLLSELEIFSPLANTEWRKPLGLVGLLRENDGTTHSLEKRTYCSKQSKLSDLQATHCIFSQALMFRNKTKLN